MAAWVCVACTTVYHVDSPRCPQCGGVAHIELGEPMPKSNATGVSHAAAGIGPDPIGPPTNPRPDDEVPTSGSQGPAGDVDDGDGTDTATGSTEPTSDADEAPDDNPTRPGSGATREAWAEHAQRVHGIDPTGLSRAQLIDAVNTAETVTA